MPRSKKYTRFNLSQEDRKYLAAQMIREDAPYTEVCTTTRFCKATVAAWVHREGWRERKGGARALPAEIERAIRLHIGAKERYNNCEIARQIEKRFSRTVAPITIGRFRKKIEAEKAAAIAARDAADVAAVLRKERLSQPVQDRPKEIPEQHLRLA